MVRGAQRMRGFFVVFEGGDGCGKSTLLRLTAQRLRRTLTQRVRVTKEPGGGGGVSQAVRRLLLNQTQRLDPVTELFLYEASRSYHASTFLLPQLRQGHLILCDRFTASTVAYQGAYWEGRPAGSAFLKKANFFAAHGLRPDAVVWMDLPVKDQMERLLGRGVGGTSPSQPVKAKKNEQWNVFDRQKRAFHQKIRARYQKMMAGQKNTLLCDGLRSPETIADEVACWIVQKLAERRDLS